MRVTEKGQVTIPRTVLEALGLSPSSEVEFSLEGGRAYLVKKRDPHSAGRASHEAKAGEGLSADEFAALLGGMPRNREAQN
jgi:AbrB family looped-hinge helix DNA binding protein